MSQRNRKSDKRYADAVKAINSVGRRPTRSENFPHRGALKSCATVKAAMMKPAIMPMPKWNPENIDSGTAERLHVKRQQRNDHQQADHVDEAPWP